MDLFQGCSGKTLANGLSWLREPQDWGFADGRLSVVPEGKTDFFRPFGGRAVDNACLLSLPVAGDFTAVTEASAVLAGFGDAAAMTVRADPRHWAKICIERSPIGETSVVSVVTDGFSDDANNELVGGPFCWLRLTRAGGVFAMHYSLDGARWRFVRTFGMKLPAEVHVGIHAQAPFGSGCRATFMRFTLDHTAVRDFRSGQ